MSESMSMNVTHSIESIVFVNELSLLNIYKYDDLSFIKRSIFQNSGNGSRGAR